MCKEFEENRKKLTQIIYSQRSGFTECEIADEYKKATGHMILDAYQTVSGYVRELKDFGALKYSKGRYFVK